MRRASLVVVVLCLAGVLCEEAVVTSDHSAAVPELENTVLDGGEESPDKECRDKAKWCPCMAEACGNSRVNKRCPKTCTACPAGGSEVDSKDEPSGFGFSSFYPATEEEIWDPIEEDEDEGPSEEGDWEPIDKNRLSYEDSVRRMSDYTVGLVEHAIARLGVCTASKIKDQECHCYVKTYHDVHDCPNVKYGSVDVNKKGRYHKYCYQDSLQADFRQKQCCKATTAFLTYKNC